ncbi:hypothetical protein NQ315_004740 [Exocentrus adspersus]|uniref:Uncharacterized protein n=1 Tax=Exocentrus adspersus TaxID=1586481 RepID=A0AAV8W3B0_9CUCU|nr:hypothetical protein NQ315_004740 [Exocentrus adspersus]
MKHDQMFRSYEYLSTLLLLLFVWPSGVVSKFSYDYYWRDYTGNIPYDAVDGGWDVNNETTYIGQVFVKDHGIIPVTIYPGVTEVTANIKGLHTLHSYIKILCSSSKQNFEWYSATAKDLHLQMINKHLVQGGVDNDLITNIGRILYQGEVKVAKVCGFDVGNAKLYFPAETEEKDADSYEVLVYNTNNPPITVRMNVDGVVSKFSYDYYWRDYTGNIPYDAVDGGWDVNNETTYIGQVFVKDHGIIPVTIYPGITEVTANIKGLHTLHSYIKILCSSSKQNFEWYSATSKDLHLQMINKHLVRGGVEYDLITNIGRILYQGEVKVAKVCGFAVGNAKLYFPAETEEKGADSYEVLVYNANNPPNTNNTNTTNMNMIPIYQ